jgi:tRNA(adenine34) deaminase
MGLGVTDVYYGLESLADGGGPIVPAWKSHPTMPWFTAPTMTAGINRDRARDQFQCYVETAEESGYKKWARSVLDLTAPAA